MTHVPHDLPEMLGLDAAEINRLEEGDPHLARQCEAYRELNREIHRCETDVQPTSGKGRTEIRAFYGGVQLGVVAFGLLTLLLRPDWLAPACAALACMNLAIVACRLLGFALDGSASGSLWTILAIEATTGVLALAGFLAVQQASRTG